MPHFHFMFAWDSVNHENNCMWQQYNYVKFDIRLSYIQVHESVNKLSRLFTG